MNRLGADARSKLALGELIDEASRKLKEDMTVPYEVAEARLDALDKLIEERMGK